MATSARRVNNSRGSGRANDLGEEPPATDVDALHWVPVNLSTPPSRRRVLLDEQWGAGIHLP